jgi:hypothetical protein
MQYWIAGTKESKLEFPVGWLTAFLKPLPSHSAQTPDTNLAA